MKEGWLWLSILKTTAWPSPISTMPAFSPGPRMTPLAGGRQGPQPFLRGFVRAVLVPHGREDAELGHRRLAADQVEDALVFVGLQAVGGDEVGGDWQRPVSKSAMSFTTLSSGCLVIGAQHGVHAGQMALSLRLEPLEDVRVDAQMNGCLRPIPWHDQFRVAPEFLVELDRWGIRRGGRRFAALMPCAQLIERVAPDIASGRSGRLSTPR